MSTARAEVYLVAMARTPFGRFQGMLAGMEPRDFAVRALDAAVGRLGAEVPVDALYCGIGLLAGGALTYVRQMLLTSATLPETIPSLAVDRACCSGMSAIGLAFRDIRLGEAEVVVAGGFDGLSRMPLLAERNPTTRPGERTLADPLLLRTPLLDRSIAQYTSDEALARGIDRVA